jgi:catechol 2,3-dioxygenase-like lactoylglutathione lyase family enzyme
MNVRKPRIAAATLFVGDIQASKAFYKNIFGLPIHFPTDDSVVFRFGEMLKRRAPGQRRAMRRGVAPRPADRRADAR